MSNDTKPDPSIFDTHKSFDLPLKKSFFSINLKVEKQTVFIVRIFFLHLSAEATFRLARGPLSLGSALFYKSQSLISRVKVAVGFPDGA